MSYVSCISGGFFTTSTTWEALLEYQDLFYSIPEGNQFLEDGPSPALQEVLECLTKAQAWPQENMAPHTRGKNSLFLAGSLFTPGTVL